MKKLLLIIGALVIVIGLATGFTIAITHKNVPKELPVTSFPASEPVSQTPATSGSSTPSEDCSQYGTLNPYDMPSFGSLSDQENQQMLCEGLNSIGQTIKSEQ